MNKKQLCLSINVFDSMGASIDALCLEPANPQIIPALVQLLREDWKLEIRCKEFELSDSN